MGGYGYVLLVFCVFIFVGGAPCVLGGRWGWEGVVRVIFCAAVGWACSRSCVCLTGSNRAYARALGQLSVCEGVRHFFSPPKFCFTPEPVCSLYQKKATIIGPLFRPLIPCGLTMLPWLL